MACITIIILVIIIIIIRILSFSLDELKVRNSCALRSFGWHQSACSGFDY